MSNVRREFIEAQIITASKKHKQWYIRCLAAFDFYQENGHYNFEPGSELAIWARSTRQRWDRLPVEFKTLLRHMGFPKEADRSVNKVQPRADVKDLLELRAKVDAGKASAEEKVDLQKRIGRLAVDYRAGRLSARHAETLGIA